MQIKRKGETDSEKEGKKQRKREKEREKRREEKAGREAMASERQPRGDPALPTRDRRALSAAAAGSELLRVSNPGRLSDITPFLVG